MSFFFAVAIAFLVGLSITYQSILNTALKFRVGIPYVIMIVSLVQLLLSVVAVMIGRAFNMSPKFPDFSGIPKFLLLGGVFGFFIVGGAIYVFERLGATAALVIFVLAQLAFSLYADHVGLLGIPKTPFSWQRALGVAVILVGIFLTRR